MMHNLMKIFIFGILKYSYTNNLLCKNNPNNTGSNIMALKTLGLPIIPSSIMALF